MLKSLAKNAAQGLLTILPLALTLYAFWWVGAGLAGFWTMPLIRLLVKEGMLPAQVPLYIYIAGYVAGIIVLIFVGILAHYFLTRGLLAFIERLVNRVPLGKTLYGSIKDLLGLFSGEARAFSRVVLVPLPGLGQKVLGMVTREDLSSMTVVPPDVVAVYVPMSYQIGGFTIFVPRNSLEALDLSVEEALRFAVTAGVSTRKSLPQPPIS